MTTPATERRVAVVTGASSGIGEATAKVLAAQGFHVVCVARRAELVEALAAEISGTASVTDVTDRAAVEALADQLDRVDVLVNNAGGNTDMQRPEPADDDLTALAENWRANLDANVMSAVLVTAALTPRFADNARIVTLGSIAARQGAGSYGAAKAAVEAWTASLAADLGPRGVTANVVAPGLIVGTEFFRGRMTEAGVQRRVAATRNGRAGTVDDVAATVTFLASPSAGHITGQVIHLNGGAYLGR